MAFFCCLLQQVIYDKTNLISSQDTFNDPVFTGGDDSMVFHLQKSLELTNGIGILKSFALNGHRFKLTAQTSKFFIKKASGQLTLTVSDVFFNITQDDANCFFDKAVGSQFVNCAFNLTANAADSALFESLADSLFKDCRFYFSAASLTNNVYLVARTVVATSFVNCSFDVAIQAGTASRLSMLAKTLRSGNQVLQTLNVTIASTGDSYGGLAEAVSGDTLALRGVRFSAEYKAVSAPVSLLSLPQAHAYSITDCGIALAVEAARADYEFYGFGKLILKDFAASNVEISLKLGAASSKNVSLLAEEVTAGDVRIELSDVHVELLASSAIAPSLFLLGKRLTAGSTAPLESAMPRVNNVTYAFGDSVAPAALMLADTCSHTKLSNITVTYRKPTQDLVGWYFLPFTAENLIVDGIYVLLEARSIKQYVAAIPSDTSIVNSTCAGSRISNLKYNITLFEASYFYGVAHSVTNCDVKGIFFNVSRQLVNVYAIGEQVKGCNVNNTYSNAMLADKGDAVEFFACQVNTTDAVNAAGYVRQCTACVFNNSVSNYSTVQKFNQIAAFCAVCDAATFEAIKATLDVRFADATGQKPMIGGVCGKCSGVNITKANVYANVLVDPGYYVNIAALIGFLDGDIYVLRDIYLKFSAGTVIPPKCYTMVGHHEYTLPADLATGETPGPHEVAYIVDYSVAACEKLNINYEDRRLPVAVGPPARYAQFWLYELRFKAVVCLGFKSVFCNTHSGVIESVNLAEAAQMRYFYRSDRCDKLEALIEGVQCYCGNQEDLCAVGSFCSQFDFTCKQYTDCADYEYVSELCKCGAVPCEPGMQCQGGKCVEMKQCAAELTTLRSDCYCKEDTNIICKKGNQCVDGHCLAARTCGEYEGDCQCVGGSGGSATCGAAQQCDFASGKCIPRQCATGVLLPSQAELEAFVYAYTNGRDLTPQQWYLYEFTHQATNLTAALRMLSAPCSCNVMECAPGSVCGVDGMCQELATTCSTTVLSTSNLCKCQEKSCSGVSCTYQVCYPGYKCNDNTGKCEEFSTCRFDQYLSGDCICNGNACHEGQICSTTTVGAPACVPFGNCDLESCAAGAVCSSDKQCTIADCETIGVLTKYCKCGVNYCEVGEQCTGIFCVKQCADNAIARRDCMCGINVAKQGQYCQKESGVYSVISQDESAGLSLCGTGLCPAGASNCLDNIFCTSTPICTLNTRLTSSCTCGETICVAGKLCMYDEAAPQKLVCSRILDCKQVSGDATPCKCSGELVDNRTLCSLSSVKTTECITAKCENGKAIAAPCLCGRIECTSDTQYCDNGVCKEMGACIATGLSIPCLCGNDICNRYRDCKSIGGIKQCVVAICEQQKYLTDYCNCDNQICSPNQYCSTQYICTNIEISSDTTKSLVLSNALCEAGTTCPFGQKCFTSPVAEYKKCVNVPCERNKLITAEVEVCYCGGVKCEKDQFCDSDDVCRKAPDCSSISGNKYEVCKCGSVMCTDNQVCVGRVCQLKCAKNEKIDAACYCESGDLCTVGGYCDLGNTCKASIAVCSLAAPEDICYCGADLSVNPDPSGTGTICADYHHCFQGVCYPRCAVDKNLGAYCECGGVLCSKNQYCDSGSLKCTELGVCGPYDASTAVKPCASGEIVVCDVTEYLDGSVCKRYPDCTATSSLLGFCVTGGRACANTQYSVAERRCVDNQCPLNALLTKDCLCNDALAVRTADYCDNSGSPLALTKKTLPVCTDDTQLNALGFCKHGGSAPAELLCATDTRICTVAKCDKQRVLTASCTCGAQLCKSGSFCDYDGTCKDAASPCVGNELLGAVCQCGTALCGPGSYCAGATCTAVSTACSAAATDGVPCTCGAAPCQSRDLCVADKCITELCGVEKYLSRTCQCGLKSCGSSGYCNSRGECKGLIGCASTGVSEPCLCGVTPCDGSSNCVDIAGIALKQCVMQKCVQNAYLSTGCTCGGYRCGANQYCSEYLECVDVKPCEVGQSLCLHATQTSCGSETCGDGKKCFLSTEESKKSCVKTQCKVNAFINEVCYCNDNICPANKMCNFAGGCVVPTPCPISGSSSALCSCNKVITEERLCKGGAVLPNCVLNGAIGGNCVCGESKGVCTSDQYCDGSYCEGVDLCENVLDYELLSSCKCGTSQCGAGKACIGGICRTKCVVNQALGEVCWLSEALQCTVGQYYDGADCESGNLCSADTVTSCILNKKLCAFYLPSGGKCATECPVNSLLREDCVCNGALAVKATQYCDKSGSPLLLLAKDIPDCTSNTPELGKLGFCKYTGPTTPGTLICDSATSTCTINKCVKQQVLTKECQCGTSYCKSGSFCDYDGTCKDAASPCVGNELLGAVCQCGTALCGPGSYCAGATCTAVSTACSAAATDGVPCTCGAAPCQSRDLCVADKCITELCGVEKYLSRTCQCGLKSCGSSGYCNSGTCTALLTCPPSASALPCLCGGTPCDSTANCVSLPGITTLQCVMSQCRQNSYLTSGCTCGAQRCAAGQYCSRYFECVFAPPCTAPLELPCFDALRSDCYTETCAPGHRCFLTPGNVANSCVKAFCEADVILKAQCFAGTAVCGIGQTSNGIDNCATPTICSAALSFGTKCFCGERHTDRVHCNVADQKLVPDCAMNAAGTAPCVCGGQFVCSGLQYCDAGFCKAIIGCKSTLGGAPCTCGAETCASAEFCHFGVCHGQCEVNVEIGKHCLCGRTVAAGDAYCSAAGVLEQITSECKDATMSNSVPCLQTTDIIKCYTNQEITAVNNCQAYAACSSITVDGAWCLSGNRICQRGKYSVVEGKCVDNCQTDVLSREDCLCNDVLMKKGEAYCKYGSPNNIITDLQDCSATGSLSLVEYCKYTATKPEGLFCYDTPKTCSIQACEKNIVLKNPCQCGASKCAKDQYCGSDDICRANDCEALKVGNVENPDYCRCGTLVCASGASCYTTPHACYPLCTNNVLLSGEMRCICGTNVCESDQYCKSGDSCVTPTTCDASSALGVPCNCSAGNPCQSHDLCSTSGHCTQLNCKINEKIQDTCQCGFKSCPIGTYCDSNHICRLVGDCPAYGLVKQTCQCGSSYCTAHFCQPPICEKSEVCVQEGPTNPVCIGQCKANTIPVDCYCNDRKCGSHQYCNIDMMCVDLEPCVFGAEVPCLCPTLNPLTGIELTTQCGSAANCVESGKGEYFATRAYCAKNSVLTRSCTCGKYQCLTSQYCRGDAGSEQCVDLKQCVSGQSIPCLCDGDACSGSCVIGPPGQQSCKLIDNYCDQLSELSGACYCQLSNQGCGASNMCDAGGACKPLPTITCPENALITQLCRCKKSACQIGSICSSDGQCVTGRCEYGTRSRERFCICGSTVCSKDQICDSGTLSCSSDVVCDEQRQTECKCLGAQCSAGEFCINNKCDTLASCPLDIALPKSCQCGSSATCSTSQYCHRTDADAYSCVDWANCTAGYPLPCKCKGEYCKSPSVCYASTGRKCQTVSTYCEPLSKIVESCYCKVSHQECGVGKMCDQLGFCTEFPGGACPDVVIGSQCDCFTRACPKGARCTSAKRCEYQECAQDVLFDAEYCRCGADTCSRGQICDSSSSQCVEQQSCSGALTTNCFCSSMLCHSPNVCDGGTCKAALPCSVDEALAAICACGSSVCQIGQYCSGQECSAVQLCGSTNAYIESPCKCKKADAALCPRGHYCNDAFVCKSFGALCTALEEITTACKCKDTDTFACPIGGTCNNGICLAFCPLDKVLDKECLCFRELTRNAVCKYQQTCAADGSCVDHDKYCVQTGVRISVPCVCGDDDFFCAAGNYCWGNICQKSLITKVQYLSGVSQNWQQEFSGQPQLVATVNTDLGSQKVLTASSEFAVADSPGGTPGSPPNRCYVRSLPNLFEFHGRGSQTDPFGAVTCSAGFGNDAACSVPQQTRVCQQSCPSGSDDPTKPYGCSVPFCHGTCVGAGAASECVCDKAQQITLDDHFYTRDVKLTGFEGEYCERRIAQCDCLFAQVCKFDQSTLFYHCVADTSIVGISAESDDVCGRGCPEVADGDPLGFACFERRCSAHGICFGNDCVLNEIGDGSAAWVWQYQNYYKMTDDGAAAGSSGICYDKEYWLARNYKGETVAGKNVTLPRSCVSCTGGATGPSCDICADYNSQIQYDSKCYPRVFNGNYCFQRDDMALVQSGDGALQNRVISFLDQQLYAWSSAGKYEYHYSKQGDRIYCYECAPGYAMVEDGCYTKCTDGDCRNGDCYYLDNSLPANENGVNYFCLEDSCGCVHQDQANPLLCEIPYYYRPDALERYKCMKQISNTHGLCYLIDGTTRCFCENSTDGSIQYHFINNGCYALCDSADARPDKCPDAAANTCFLYEPQNDCFWIGCGRRAESAECAAADYQEKPQCRVCYPCAAAQVWDGGACHDRIAGQPNDCYIRAAAPHCVGCTAGYYLHKGACYVVCTSPEEPCAHGVCFESGSSGITCPECYPGAVAVAEGRSTKCYQRVTDLHGDCYLKDAEVHCSCYLGYRPAEGKCVPANSIEVDGSQYLPVAGKHGECYQNILDANDVLCTSCETGFLLPRCEGCATGYRFDQPSDSCVCGAGYSHPATAAEIAAFGPLACIKPDAGVMGGSCYYAEGVAVCLSCYQGYDIGTNCADCTLGYVKTGSACVKDTSCGEISTGTAPDQIYCPGCQAGQNQLCTACNTGYILIDGVCMKRSAVVGGDCYVSEGGRITCLEGSVCLEGTVNATNPLRISCVACGPAYFTRNGLCMAPIAPFQFLYHGECYRDALYGESVYCSKCEANWAGDVCDRCAAGYTACPCEGSPTERCCCERVAQSIGRCYNNSAGEIVCTQCGPGYKGKDGTCKKQKSAPLYVIPILLVLLILLIIGLLVYRFAKRSKVDRYARMARLRQGFAGSYVYYYCVAGAVLLGLIAGVNDLFIDNLGAQIGIQFVSSAPLALYFVFVQLPQQRSFALRGRWDILLFMGFAVIDTIVAVVRFAGLPEQYSVSSTNLQAMSLFAVILTFRIVRSARFNKSQLAVAFFVPLLPIAQYLAFQIIDARGFGFFSGMNRSDASVAWLYILVGVALVSAQAAILQSVIGRYEPGQAMLLLATCSCVVAGLSGFASVAEFTEIAGSAGFWGCALLTLGYHLLQMFIVASVTALDFSVAKTSGCAFAALVAASGSFASSKSALASTGPARVIAAAVVFAAVLALIALFAACHDPMLQERRRIEKAQNGVQGLLRKSGQQKAEGADEALPAKSIEAMRALQRALLESGAAQTDGSKVAGQKFVFFRE